MQHPGITLKELIAEKGLNQKDLANVLWKSKSTINEIIKGKRNFTIHRDYELHKWIWTKIWFWIKKQLEFDYTKFLEENKETKQFEKQNNEKNDKIMDNNDKVQVDLGTKNILSDKENTTSYNISIEEKKTQNRTEESIQKKEPEKNIFAEKETIFEEF